MFIDFHTNRTKQTYDEHRDNRIACNATLLEIAQCSDVVMMLMAPVIFCNFFLSRFIKPVKTQSKCKEVTKIEISSKCKNIFFSHNRTTFFILQIHFDQYINCSSYHLALSTHAAMVWNQINSGSSTTHQY